MFDTTSKYPVLVLSNIYGVEGAVYIAFDDILPEIKSKLKKDFYILSSSISEFLIIPKSFVTPDFIIEMIKDVNNTNILTLKE